MMGFMGMWWLWIIVAAIVFIALYMGNYLKQSNSMSSLSSDSAIDILKKRFANGEIGKDEYEKMKKDLSK